MVELPSLVPAEFVVPARLEAEHGLLLRMLSAADVEVRAHPMDQQSLFPVDIAAAVTTLSWRK